MPSDTNRRKNTRVVKRSAHHAERDGYVAVTAPRDEPSGITRGDFLKSV